MRIIALTNQKGGVAKSTSTINIGAILGQMGKKVLVVDLDPQGNSTTGLGVNAEELEYTVYECLTDELPIEKAIHKTKFKNVDIIAAFITLANAELEIAAMMGREALLKESIENSNLDYDFMILDLPPSLGLLTVNGLVAADEIIIPIDCGMFALAGIEQLISTIKLIKKKLNSKLEISGVLLTKVDDRTNIAKEMRNDLSKLFGDKFFNTVIHQNIKIAEAQKEQKPISYFDGSCRGSIEYVDVCKELLGTR
nr:AAA family ATPase [Methanosarcina mazei]